MLLYARAQGLGPRAALVSAIGWMFAGRWLMHLLDGGHYMLIGLAWLPWVLLALERAIGAGSVVWTVAAGLFFGLMVLGTQPQWTFYAGILIALWTLGPVRELAAAGQGRVALLRWLLCGLGTACLGAALAAVQLLPTAE